MASVIWRRSARFAASRARGLTSGGQPNSRVSEETRRFEDSSSPVRSDRGVGAAPAVRKPIPKFNFVENIHGTPKETAVTSPSDVPGNVAPPLPKPEFPATPSPIARATIETAKPYPYELPIENTALIIIDMQRDFCEPGGFGESLGNDVSLLQAVVPQIESLLGTFRQHNLTVIHTMEAHEGDLSDLPEAKRVRGNPSQRIGEEGPLGRLLVKGSVGNAIIDQLKPIAGEHVIYKPGKGAFFHTPLDSILKRNNITNLIVTGVTTEVCVQSTLREANDRGYNCLLVEDGTASYFPEFKESVLQQVVAQGGIVGWTASSGEVVQAIEHCLRADVTAAEILRLQSALKAERSKVESLEKELTSLRREYSAAKRVLRNNVRSETGPPGQFH